MSSNNHYDVTAWSHGDPFDDIGLVINSIIGDIKRRQANSDVRDGGKPGAVIYIPPGDYRLRTQVLVDISFLKIHGSGHGFTSSSIRFNAPREDWAALHELWPGGSRVLVDLPGTDSEHQRDGAAFLVERSGSPRISSVEFSNFCIDGLHFIGEGTEGNPENSYANGKTGIYVADANDAFRITSMGMVYLEHALTIYNADAVSIHDNFIAECGNCIELRGWGQASKLTDNLIGAGFKGYSIYAENHGGLLISTNNVFPRGASSIECHGVTRSSVTNNRLHSFYPGMVLLASNSSENLIASNHFLRDDEPWRPFQGVDNGRDDLYGLLRVSGQNNSVIGNHFSEVIDSQSIEPVGASPVIIRLIDGGENYITSNHVVAKDSGATSSDSCFESQVDSLLATQALADLVVTTVMVDAASQLNTILDSGYDDQVFVDKDKNAFRATPSVGA